MKSKVSMLVVFASLMIGANACRSSADYVANENSTSELEQKRDSTGDEAAKTPNPTAEAVSSEHYRIDAARSRFTASVGVGGLLSAFGHSHTIAIRGFSGDVQLTPDSLEPASLRLTVKANTLAEVDNEFDEKDRQKINRAIRDEALEAGTHPEIVFNSTSISVSEVGEGRYQANIAGKLTMHGVTHPISFPAQVRMEGNILRAHGEFTVLHSMYNIKRLSAAGGTVKAKDHIKLSFDIVAGKV